MERYLIALDMDGTLLNSEGEISKKTSDYLKELEKKRTYYCHFFWSPYSCD